MTLKNILSTFRSWRASHRIASAILDGAALYAGANAGAAAVDAFVEPQQQIVETVENKTCAIETISDLIIPSAHADFREAAKTPKDSVLLESITSWYYADEFRNLDGSVKRINLDKAVELPTIYIRKKMREHFSMMPWVTLPVGYVGNTAVGQRSYGLGDIELVLGLQYDIPNWTFMLTTESKFPTGAFEADKKVNLGTGKYHLGEWFRATGEYGRFLITSGVGYNHHFEKSGLPEEEDSIGARLTLGWQIVPSKFIAGMEAAGDFGFEGRKKVAGGPILAFIHEKAGSFTLTWAPDWYAENTPFGQTLTFRYRKSLKF